MKLKDYTSNEPGLADLLNYAHIIDDGIILNKDGALLISYRFQGPDQYSASSSECDALTGLFNRVSTLLDDGWMLHVDTLRLPSLDYTKEGYFPHPVAEMLDEERRQRYETEGAHFENLQIMTFVWKFPLSRVKTTKHWFVENLPETDEDNTLSQCLEFFKATVTRCINLLSSQLFFEQLHTEDLLSYLNTCICGEIAPITPPPEGLFIDVILSRHPVIGGYVPKIGKKHIFALSIIGYVDGETIPALLDELTHYPLVYRWSNRFIPLSEATAEREIKRYQKNWHNKVKGLMGIVKETVFGSKSDKINLDALSMKNQTQDALTLNSNHSVRFGYWSSTIILMDNDIIVLEQAAKELSKYIEHAGFNLIQEDVNAFDAWLGTIPGHGSCNIRRLFVSSLNLGHLLPLHTIWTGTPFSDSASLLPPKSPPVFYAVTTGKTPFRFNLDVSGVGHQLVLGPTGAGKSTYLDYLIIQFFRYLDAQVYLFDKDYSHLGLTTALDGQHYDIGNADHLAFSPLAHLETSTQKMRACQFIENLVELQNVTLTPDMRSAIHAAVDSLADESHRGHRNITVLCSQIQNELVRSALHYYTVSGTFKLMDAPKDALQEGYLQTFEMKWLLEQKPEIYLPVLFYIFDTIEIRLEKAKGSVPTLLVLEEAWLYIGHDLFARKLRNWLKTLRKYNARVIFTTQSLSDLYDPTTKTLTQITASLLESCPTKIYLPNNKMDTEMVELYQKMGLTERQTEIIRDIAEEKRHYYVVTPEGNRLIDLGFNDQQKLPLAFLGLSLTKSKQLIEFKKIYGSRWVWQWLITNDVITWANYYKDNYLKNGDA